MKMIFKMNYFLFFYFLQFWGFGYCQGNEENGMDFFTQIIIGLNTLATKVINFANDNGILDKISHSECIQPPKECPNENVTFWYFTRSLAGEPIQLSISDLDSFKNVQKNQDPWKIIIHGYTKSKDETPNPEIEEAYFRHRDYNMISVDYEPLARDRCYLQAALNVPLVASCTAQIIDALIEKGIVKSEDLHVIGLGLGGQVAGHLYKYMKHNKPNRITGLDPVDLLFDGYENGKLNKDSADFVDVIHTNAFIRGKFESSGHVDFYTNGGINQPGCLADEEKSFVACSQDRSVLYYAESINSKQGFWGIPCNNYFSFYGGLCDCSESDLVPMGEYTPHTARGSYYLETSNTEPYALGKRTKISEV